MTEGWEIFIRSNDGREVRVVLPVLMAAQSIVDEQKANCAFSVGRCT